MLVVYHIIYVNATFDPDDFFDAHKWNTLAVCHCQFSVFCC